MRRFSVLPKLVSKKCTSGRLISRISSRSIFMLFSPFRKRNPPVSPFKKGGLRGICIIQLNVPNITISKSISIRVKIRKYYMFSNTFLDTGKRCIWREQIFFWIYFIQIVQCIFCWTNLKRIYFDAKEKYLNCFIYSWSQLSYRLLFSWFISSYVTRYLEWQWM